MKLKKYSKPINILKFIGILQFSQMHLIFEINISEEIKNKMIEKNFNETLMCFKFVHFCEQRFKTPLHSSALTFNSRC